MVFDFPEKTYEYDLPEDRKDLVDLVLGAFRSIRGPVAYVSMPITSGKLLYDVLEKKGVTSLAELAQVDKPAIYDDIIKPNVDMGIAAADKITTTLPPLAPSVFEGKKFRWSQEEYMALWLKVIEERAREMHMTEGWEYSNGGVQEFTRAMQMYHFINYSPERYLELSEWNRTRLTRDMATIKVFDMDGERLRLVEGRELVQNAIADLHKRGFDASSLEQSAIALDAIHDELLGNRVMLDEDMKYHKVYGSSNEMIYLSKSHANL